MELLLPVPLPRCGEGLEARADTKNFSYTEFLPILAARSKAI
jgi:hypothetical protein